MKIAVLLGLAMALEILGSHLYTLKSDLKSQSQDSVDIDMISVVIIDDELIKQADNPVTKNTLVSMEEFPLDNDALRSYTDFTQFEEQEQPEQKKTQIIATHSTKQTQKKIQAIISRPIRKSVSKPVEKKVNSKKIDYWVVVHSIESKQGRLLYRPRNKARNCTWTTGPCGHHQLTVKALKDIGCKSLQCRKDRLNYSKSLEMSKKLLALNEKRLRKNGYKNLEDYQRYLIHQQGASGIKNILAATKGKKLLSRATKRNMANNSPFSYRQLRRLGSKLAAQKFMSHWEEKWENEKKIVIGVDIASNTTTSSSQSTDGLHNVPTFSEGEIKLALNYEF